MSSLLTEWKKVVVVTDEVIAMFEIGQIIVSKIKKRFITYEIKSANGMIVHSTESARPFHLEQNNVIIICDEVEEPLKNEMYYQCVITTDSFYRVWIHQNDLKAIFLGKQNV